MCGGRMHVASTDCILLDQLHKVKVQQHAETTQRDGVNPVLLL